MILIGSLSKSRMSVAYQYFNAKVVESARIFLHKTSQYVVMNTWFPGG